MKRRKTRLEVITATRKEADITQGLDGVQRMVLQFGTDLGLVMNHSGGKDSTRMLGLVREKLPDSPTYAVMADAGFEHVSPI